MRSSARRSRATRRNRSPSLLKVLYTSPGRTTGPAPERTRRADAAMPERVVRDVDLLDVVVERGREGFGIAVVTDEHLDLAREESFVEPAEDARAPLVSARARDLERRMIGVRDQRERT